MASSVCLHWYNSSSAWKHKVFGAKQNKKTHQRLNVELFNERSTEIKHRTQFERKLNNIVILYILTHHFGSVHVWSNLVGNLLRSRINRALRMCETCNLSVSVGLYILYTVYMQIYVKMWVKSSYFSVTTQMIRLTLLHLTAKCECLFIYTYGNALK